VLTLDPNKGGEFADVDTFVRQQVGLELTAMEETRYYGKLAAFFRPIQIMVWVTAALIALGGLFGGLNTMYAAFASRIRELGALQAMGFSRRAIVVSLVQESVLSAGAGALLGAALGVLILDGRAVRFSMGAFGLAVEPAVIALAVAAGLALGVLGALPPAFRCLRPPINVALKSS
jgi:putative ABC transport system permease protein